MSSNRRPSVGKLVTVTATDVGCSFNGGRRDEERPNADRRFGRPEHPHLPAAARLDANRAWPTRRRVIPASAKIRKWREPRVCRSAHRGSERARGSSIVSVRRHRDLAESATGSIAARSSCRAVFTAAAAGFRQNGQPRRTLRIATARRNPRPGQCDHNQSISQKVMRTSARRRKRAHRREFSSCKFRVGTAHRSRACPRSALSSAGRAGPTCVRLCPPDIVRPRLSADPDNRIAWNAAADFSLP
jgi:hypothetical protein